MSNLITTQINQLAERFELPQNEELYQVLKSTAFKGEVTDAQLSALLIVAKQYGLNPWTKEIYAFPDKGGIVPVVGVDGWSRIINSSPQFDGMDFEQNADSCTCVIYRKDRSHPIKVTEWMAECKRAGVKPWESHPYRMLRHKAMIQCARIAFGFGGIYDQDEAERIVAGPSALKSIDPSTGEIVDVVFDVTAALDAVENCHTAAELKVTWQTEGAKATAAKDSAGHATLKAAVKARKTAIELAESAANDNIVDVEAK